MTVDETMRWGGEGVIVHPALTLGDVRPLLPTFERRPANTWLGRPDHPGVPREDASHRYLDAIVRVPDGQHSSPMPVALVSKKYTLVQHVDLVDALAKAVRKHLDEDVGRLPTVLALTEYGSRVGIEVRLPARFCLPDPYEVAPTLYCWNSVDGSRPLEVYLGWVRLVCRNGLVIGDMRAKAKRRHVRSLSLDDVADEVDRAVEGMRHDANVLHEWASLHLAARSIAPWTDGVVTEMWGVGSACRVFNILATGKDGRPFSGDAKLPPSRRPFAPHFDVPGSQPPNHTVYRAAQALSWVAKMGREIESAQDRLLEIPELLAPLVNGAQRVAAGQALT